MNPSSFLRVFFLSLLCSAGMMGYAQKPLYLAADSLIIKRGDLLSDWRFQPGDNASWALPQYDDHAWPMVESWLEMPEAKTKQGFKGICWFRLPFVVDSSLVNVALAYSLSQQGASIVYLDGRPLDTLGRVGDAKTSRYYNPTDDPETFVLTRPGLHLLAVRYANYAAANNWERYAVDEAGFRMHLGFAETMAKEGASRKGLAAGIMMLMLGLFFALAMLHFLLFIYNRHNRSHLLFALFSLCLSLIGVCAYVFSFAPNPAFSNRWDNRATLIPFGAIFFLSAFLNSVFPLRRKWLFWIIAALCAGGAVLVFFPHIDISITMVPAIALMAIEAVFITVRAMLQRQPGARILGAGFLLFAGFILSLFVLAGVGITSVHFDSNDGPKGLLLLLLAVMVVLSIPLSISAFLAQGVARTNKDLKLRLDQVATLSEQTRQQEEEKQRLLETRQEELEREVAVRTEDLRHQKQRSDDLLLNILPAEVAEELKENGQAVARQFAEVTVLFTDFVGFTQVSERLSPQVLVKELHECFTAFDAIMEKWGLEKIKTIGDAYLAVCGLPIADIHHATNTVNAALEIRDFMASRGSSHEPFNIRIGIHSGPVVAGIVGVKKFAYDIWGDTVNTAARMEQSGEEGKVNISAATYELVKKDFQCTPRGKIAAKGKGEIEMYFVAPLVSA